MRSQRWILLWILPLEQCAHKHAQREFPTAAPDGVITAGTTTSTGDVTLSA
jgi:hypothetical protein